MKKVTDWFWKVEVKSQYLVKQGWQDYQIVDHGGSYSVSLAKSDGSLRRVEVIAEKVESFDRAVELINEYDSDSYEMPKAYIILIVLAVILIPAVSLFLPAG